MQTDNNNNPVSTEMDYRVTTCVGCEEIPFDVIVAATSEGGPFGTF
jgi:hypothetical protein